MKLVPNWRRSWRWLSQHCFVAAGALTATWSQLGALQSSIPAKYVTAIAAAICALGFVGRLVDQSPKDGGDDAKP